MNDLPDNLRLVNETVDLVDLGFPRAAAGNGASASPRRAGAAG
jgi:hypothetical protein